MQRWNDSIYHILKTRRRTTKTRSIKPKERWGKKKKEKKKNQNCTYIQKCLNGKFSFVTTNHQPVWMIHWVWHKESEANLQQLSQSTECTLKLHQCGLWSFEGCYRAVTSSGLEDCNYSKPVGRMSMPLLYLVFRVRAHFFLSLNLRFFK